MADGSHRLAEWETDLSSQTGASQAGILLGSDMERNVKGWASVGGSPRGLEQRTALGSDGGSD